MIGAITQSWNQLEGYDRLSHAVNPGDPFEKMLAQEGEVVREAPGRRTLRFAVNGQSYFVKVHTGVGWGEILKNVLRLRKPALSAIDEWRALHRVRELGITTARPIAFGCRGWDPARLQSFIVTEDLGATITLARLSQDWRDGRIAVDLDLKRRIINEVARIARTLHEHGINHRDFYLCHFRIDESVVRQPERKRTLTLYLMDLHRAQLRDRLPRRWLIKDLASLLYSAFDAPITFRDLLRFARAYLGTPLRGALMENRRLLRQVSGRASRMYRIHHRSDPPVLDFRGPKRRSWKE